MSAGAQSADPVAPWEPARESDRPLPFDQLAYAGDSVVSVRVTPSRSVLTVGEPGESRRRTPLTVKGVTIYARAGRVTLHRVKDDDLTLLMLGRRESRGMAVGDRRRRFVTGQARGAAGVALAVPRTLTVALVSPYAIYRSSQTSKERNEAVRELCARVLTVFPDATVGTV